MSWSRFQRTRTGLAGVVRRQRRECGRSGRLRFLAAESAAHPQALHDDFVGGELQQVGDDGLHLGGMLGGRRDEHGPVLTGLGPRRLRFQIEMLLPLQFEHSRQRHW